MLNISSSKFLSVWKLTSEYAFIADSDVRFEDYKCVLCKKLLVDAVVSSMCGCQYCFGCIRQHLDGTEKNCPGDKEECKDEFLAFDRNIFRSALLNKKISRLKVICPNDACDVRCELINMEDHLKTCSHQPMACPYVTLGCSCEKSTKDTIEGHLHSDMVTHSGILIEFIKALQSEVTELKHNLAKCYLENQNLTEALNDKKNRIEKLEKEFPQLRNKIDTRRTEETEKTQKEILLQRREIELQKIERKKMIQEVKDLRNNFKELKDVKDKYDLIATGKIVKLNKICPGIDIDFIWRIEDCKKKILKTLFSGSFYSNNYKMCLSIQINNDDCIALCCHIMKGRNDDTVEWPMKLSVTLSIIDQETMLQHTSETYQYDSYQGDKHAFERPKTCMNELPIGSASFTTYSAISYGSIIFNGSMIIWCFITDP